MFNIILKFVFRAFFYHNPSTVHIVLNWYWHTLIEVKSLIVAWNRPRLSPLIAHQETVNYKLRRITFETPWGKLQVTAKIKLVHKIYHVCDHLKHPKRLLNTNWELPDLLLYTFKLVFRTTLETPYSKLRILLEMKLTSDVTIAFLLAVNNDNSIYFLCHSCGLWN